MAAAALRTVQTAIAGTVGGRCPATHRAGVVKAIGSATAEKWASDAPRGSCVTAAGTLQPSARYRMKTGVRAAAY